VFGHVIYRLFFICYTLVETPHNMKTAAMLLAAICMLSAAFSQQNPPKSPCTTNPVYRQFDFWIGEWEAFGPRGKGGDSRVERLLDSCVILENWTSVQGNYSGKSYNTFNAATGKWQQYWVDNKGGVTQYFDGHFENDKMILQTADQKQADGSSKIQKMTFYRLGADKVRQHGESSIDGGATWKTDFDLEYRRKK
jgi:hypothetical protein